MKEDFVVGDYIIDFAYIYRITAVTKQDGQDDMLIHYQPIVGQDKVFTASIPVKSMKKSGTRKVITAKEVKEIMKAIGSKEADGEYNVMSAKEDIYQNDWARVIPLIKCLWGKKNDGLGKTDVELMEQMITHLCREIAFVTKKTYGAVRKEIESALNKTKGK